MSDLMGGPGRVTTGILVAGWVFAVIFPIVGLVIGVVILSKGVATHGWAIIVLSVVMIAVNLLLIF